MTENQSTTAQPKPLSVRRVFALLVVSLLVVACLMDDFLLWWAFR